MKRILLVVVALLVACTPNVASEPPGAAAPPGTPELPPLLLASELGKAPGVARLAALRAFQSCSDLEVAIQEKLIAQMRAELTSSLRQTLQYYRAGYNPYGWGGADAGSAGSGGGSGGSGGSGGGSSGPTDVTTTNVQVAGVDEPDFVKNDGNRIFVLAKGKLFTSLSWPAASLALQGSLAIPGTALEMFLDGDTVTVFSTDYSHSYTAEATTLATVIDVSDLSAPKISGNYSVPGYYRGARRIGKSVRVVTGRYFYWPLNLTTWMPYWRTWSSELEIITTYFQLASENEAKIRGAKLEAFLPTASWHTPLQDVVFPVDCSGVQVSSTVAHLGYSAVTSFQTDVPGQLHQQVIFENADEIYADDDSLYLTSRHWWWYAEPGQRDATYIHKFDTRAPGSVTYVATGVVDGHLVDQFAMDEWKGNLRVATTIWESGAAWNNTTNRISVLTQAGGRLLPIGESEPIGTGERITSARFLGDVGYVVTFRQTDPLFVFDLKDPVHPTKVGELQVPGFSSYLHPLDSTHLLTIGTYQPAGGNWSTRSVQLAIFDVSDLTAPRQTHVELLGNASSSSEAQWEHKAFNYFPAKKLLAVPFYEWTYGQYGNGNYGYWYELHSDLRVFSVDAQLGFTAKGTLSLSDLSQRTSYYAWDAVVRRSIMADDFVYAISEAGIRVANVNALDAPLATAPFQ